MIKRHSKLIAYRIFVPSAAQNKVAKRRVTFNLHDINHLQNFKQMKFRIIKSFAKDLKKIKDKNLLEKVKKTTDNIKETIRELEHEDEIPFKIANTKKITGSENAYRIKVDNSYRIGAEIDKEKDEQTNEDVKIFSLKRFLHRKHIYEKFKTKQKKYFIYVNHGRSCFLPISVNQSLTILI